jgi:HEAT repeat protein
MESGKMNQQDRAPGLSDVAADRHFRAPGALETAFEALATYDTGAARGILLPIDEAVMAGLNGRAARKDLERRLVVALKACRSKVALEYICSKLRLVGSDYCVPAVAALLSAGEVSTAARDALEGIPGKAAARALRDCLGKVEGLEKIGAINSLGVRRDENSVRALTALLKDADLQIAAAAASALGAIGSVKTGKLLRMFLTQAPGALQQSVADAMLSCAERLVTEGRRSEAAALYEMLISPAQASQIHDAGLRGLEACKNRRMKTGGT